MKQNTEAKLIECMARHYYDKAKRQLKKALPEILASWKVMEYEDGFILYRELDSEILEFSGYSEKKHWLAGALSRLERKASELGYKKIVCESEGTMNEWLKKNGFWQAERFFTKELANV